MSRPRALWRVEWSAAWHPDRPYERHDVERNYQTAENAGDQVAEVEHWSPQFMELHGVWRCVGGSGDALEWEPVDPANLPVSDRKAARLRKLREHSEPFFAMMTRAGADE